jgi:YidC/Oxa1 family membrane protein insertase
MDKRTLLAVVISVVILVGGSFLQYVFFPPAAPKPPTAQTEAAQPAAGSQAQASQPTENPATTPEKPQPSGEAAAAQATVSPAPEPVKAQEGPETIVRETARFRLIFSRAGGVLTSIQLKEFKNADGSPVEMALHDASGQRLFEVGFGDYKTDWTTTLFNIKETVGSGQSIFEFSRTFVSVTGVPFIMRKTYRFMDNEYLMELKIAIENSVNDSPKLGPGTFAYTLSIGPQIGPTFQVLNGTTEYRSFVYYKGGRKDLNRPANQVKEVTDQVTWMGIVGKYFAFVAIPDATNYIYELDTRKLDATLERSTLHIQRPAIQSAKSEDLFRFYIGPKKRDVLSLYSDTTKNGFGVGTLHLDEVVTSPPVIGWLAQLLNLLLELIYKIIPNYGVAIILITLIIKVLFLPLTFKSSEATARMSALNPKVAEIRERMKGKPEKMNQEIADLYKREKVNPLSGCLPLLLQLPILWAIYSLLSDFFSLRGAAFIPGWISDLSAPESVWHWSTNIPLIGQDLRILPFLMLATQFLTTKVTTPQSGAQQGAQMKIFSYVLPAVFFFIFYSMPSGLVLYWTVQNLISVFQQLYINYVNKKKKELAPQVETSKFRRK